MNPFLRTALILATLFGTAHAAPPVNDNLANAALLTGDIASSTVDNAEATVESGDFAFRTVWWTWTAPANGRVTIDSVGSSVSTLALLAYLRESNGSLTGIVASDPGQQFTPTYRPRVSFPVAAGTTYLFGAGTIVSTAIGIVQVSISLSRTDPVGVSPIAGPATMAQDSFAARVALSGVVTSAIGYNTSASRQASEPTVSGERTLWWTYRSPANGRLTVSTTNSDSFGKAVAVFLGSDFPSLRVIASGTAQFSGVNLVTFTFPVTANTDYQISVGGIDTGSYGTVVLGLSLDTQADVSNLNIPFTASMANDTFAQRPLLTGTTVAAIGHNLSASTEPAFNEPTTSGSRTLWWTYRPPANGRLTVSSTGSDSFSKVVAVYLGSSLASLRQVTSQLVQFSGANVVSFSFPVTADTDYQISFGGADAGSFGSLVLGLSLDAFDVVAGYNLPTRAVAGNDSFAQAVTLPSGTVSAIGYNTAAGREALEPATYERTIWWNWTSPAAGQAIIDLTSSDLISKRVTVWTGSTISSLTQVVASLAGNAPQVTFMATAGQTYRIAVGNNSTSGTGGSVVLTIAGPSGPAGSNVPNVAIGQAVHLRWFGTNGQRYQVQKSLDLSTWTNVGAEIIGNGAFKDYFEPIGSAPGFFRIFLQQ